jgi:hypothetical protein
MGVCSHTQTLMLASPLRVCVPPCVLQAWLAGGDWHRLLPADHEGLPEVKWCMNRFVPFLAIDPQPDPNPGSRDAEESSMEVRGTGFTWSFTSY